MFLNQMTEITITAKYEVEDKMEMLMVSSYKVMKETGNLHGIAKRLMLQRRVKRLD